jgi:SAM-dependent methyltransferase
VLFRTVPYVADVWAVGEAYEAYIGRWSRPVAVEFVRWLNVPPGRRWLDVGCGTGALTETVLELADPVVVVGVDKSEGFVAHARAEVTDERVTFRVGDAAALSLPDGGVGDGGDGGGFGGGDGRADGGGFGVVVSGLAINFVPDPGRAAAEFARVAAPGGLAAAYVWDYAEGMGMLRQFWDAVHALEPAAAELDEGRRFPLCRPDPLRRLWADAGMDDVAVEPIEIPTVFAGFDDYWAPFLGGQGPAPAYVASLTAADRDALRDLLRDRLPTAPDGTIPLTARAWAVQGTVRGGLPGRPDGARRGEAGQIGDERAEPGLAGRLTPRRDGRPRRVVGRTGGGPAAVGQLQGGEGQGRGQWE